MKISPALSIKLKEINVLMTILIVWLHVSAFFDVPNFLSNIAIIAVPCFWTISAFLYFTSFDFDRPWQSYKDKVISRTKSLLVPFLIFSIVGFVFNLVAYYVHPVAVNPLEDIKSGNILKYIYESKANGPIWYLRSLYVFVLVAPLIGYVIKLSRWSLILIIPVYFFCQHISYFYFPYWMVDIFIGTYMAIYYDDLTNLRLLKYKVVRWGG